MGRFADVLLIVLFAVPSTIVGIGLIGVWNRQRAFGALYGTDAMFLLTYLARFVPVATLIVAASTKYVPMSHEEAAGVSGAGWGRTMTRIVLPQIRPGIGAAWLVAFVLAIAVNNVYLVAASDPLDGYSRLQRLIIDVSIALVAGLAAAKGAMVVDRRRRTLLDRVFGLVYLDEMVFSRAARWPWTPQA